MTQQRGANVDVVIGFETTFGTAAWIGFQLPVNSIDIKPTQTINVAQTLRGTRNPAQPFRGNKDVSGSIVVPVDSAAFWYWFKVMFDDPVTTGSGPYVHEYKVPTAQPSITIEEQFGDLDTPEFFQYLGCKVSNFSIDVGGDGELVATISIVGSNYAIDTSTCFITSIAAIDIDRVSNFQAALTEGGSSLSNGTNLSLSIDMGLDLDTFVIGGGGVRGDIPEGIVGVTGTLTTLFEDIILLNKAINSTESSLILTITDGTYIFELEIQELEYAVTAPSVDGPQGIKAALSFQGFYVNGSEASAIVARVTNGDAHA